MTKYTGWLFDAESESVKSVDYTNTNEELCRLLGCTQVKCDQFIGQDGTYCILSNENPFDKSFYNELAYCILSRIQTKWQSFHGNFLVIYMTKTNTKTDGEEVITIQNMPPITLTQFVDACNYAIEHAYTLDKTHQSV